MLKTNFFIWWDILIRSTSIYSSRNFGTCFSSDPIILLNTKIYKKGAKKAMMKYRSSGNSEGWQSGNFLLYNNPGLRISTRNVMALNYHLD